ncbi:hypothetical protein PR048_012868 [Dryococelus australis]|uniref:Uncharacterized protein n=1 Tax=Dryococelus australis TaxID=614101 RepID=A0ABQ9HRE6_9NEOP|nr:hypothetical protein PR048_012868 [Dryococelus australis]
MTTSTTKLESCSVGKNRHEDCHKENNTKKKGIKIRKTSCCDPMKVHSVPFKGSLCKINLHSILLDKSLEYLQQSPIKLHAVPQHAKESYGKRKVHELSSAVEDKLFKVLDVQLPATSTSDSI